MGQVRLYHNSAYYLEHSNIRYPLHETSPYLGANAPKLTTPVTKFRRNGRLD